MPDEKLRLERAFGRILALDRLRVLGAHLAIV